MKQRTITVFGSGLPRLGDPHYTEARALGVELSREGFVVCTGGYAGVMEAACRGAKEAGGTTIGVTAKFFASRANKWIDHEIRVKRWRDRLFELVERGDGYVVCRGGTGTLVELAVIWEMMNKGVMIGKPIVVIGDFWQPVVDRVKEIEESHRGRPGKQKELPAMYFAESPHDAVTYLNKNLRTTGPRKSVVRR